MTDKKKVSIVEALAKLPGPAGERYVTMMQHGKIEIEMYAPRGTDPQNPHTRDEVYFVFQGSGTFWDGTDRETFQPGDVIFVPAGTPHRFENFTDDLLLWALFY